MPNVKNSYAIGCMPEKGGFENAEKASQVVVAVEGLLKCLEQEEICVCKDLRLCPNVGFSSGQISVARQLEFYASAAVL